MKIHNFNCAICITMMLAVCACSRTSTNANSNKNPDVITKPTAVDPLTLPAGVLRERSLEAYAQEKMDFKPVDEYAKGMDDSALAGRRFHVIVPKQNPDSPLFSTYNPDKEKITFDVSTSEISDYGINPNWYNYINIRSDKNFGAKTLMSNAFGVTVDVTPVIERKIGIGIKGTKIGVFAPDHEFMRRLEKELKLPPEMARSVASELSTEFDGVVIKDKEGHTINCLTKNEKAKIDNTFPTTTQICIVNVRLDRVAVVSKSGVVVAWPPALGKPE